MTDRIALITGVTGQDGALLAELLLAKGYVVHGVKRRSSSFNTARVDHLELAFAEIGRTVRWQGKARDEQGVDAKTGEILVAVDPRYFRPTEVDLLLGDLTRAREKLGWTHKTTFRELVKEMVAADLVTVEREHWRYDQPD